MKKFFKALLFLGSLLFIFCGNYAQLDELPAVRLQQIDIYNWLLRDIAEYLIIVFPDGFAVSLTTDEDNRVIIPTDIKDLLLKHFERKLEDAILCIHNHDFLIRPTPSDYHAARFLNSQGFKGKHAIYHRPTKQVIYYDAD